eukprot:tig00000248_g21795.t1
MVHIPQPVLRSSTEMGTDVDAATLAFIRTYYEILQTQPRQMFRFYNPESIHLWITDETTPMPQAAIGITVQISMHPTETVKLTRSQSIEQRIADLMLHRVVVDIAAITAHNVANTYILATISGTMSPTPDAPLRGFVQTLTLAPIHGGMYIASDVLMFLPIDLTWPDVSGVYSKIPGSRFL